MEYKQYSCCNGMERLDLSKMEVPLYHVYWDEQFFRAALTIVLTPLYWLTVSHLELRTRLLSRVFCSRHVAVFIFAITVLLMGAHRDSCFMFVLRSQPKWALLQENILLWVGHASAIIGTFLVLRSFLALGFIATFMGDYFNLRLYRRVITFPYSWMTHPMYTGAFMIFLGAALVHASQAGLVLAFLAGIMYFIAASIEEPYTDGFYIPYPAGRRHVGVQVYSSMTLVQVSARTVATQKSKQLEDVEVISTGWVGDDTADVEVWEDEPLVEEPTEQPATEEQPAAERERVEEVGRSDLGKLSKKQQRLLKQKGENEKKLQRVENEQRREQPKLYQDQPDDVQAAEESLQASGDQKQLGKDEELEPNGDIEAQDLDFDDRVEEIEDSLRSQEGYHNELDSGVTEMDLDATQASNTALSKGDSSVLDQSLLDEEEKLLDRTDDVVDGAMADTEHNMHMEASPRGKNKKRRGNKKKK